MILNYYLLFTISRTSTWLKDTCDMLDEIDPSCTSFYANAFLFLPFTVYLLSIEKLSSLYSLII